MIFNREAAIAAWRLQFKYQRFMMKEDLDELEGHLRDLMGEIIAERLEEETAFHQAVRELGDFGGTDAEYRKVYWGKLRRRHEIVREVGWGFAMLRNYLKVVRRSLAKHKLYVSLNIIGLALGMACFILLMRYVGNELSYDSYLENSENIQMYRTDIKLGQIFGYFTLLALLIASLGFFGLAAFSAERRTKEIGVRKALGASGSNIIVLLLKDFTKLVALAFVIAFPLAYLAMNQWLSDFAYRSEIGVLVFIVSIVSVLAIAWFSVSFQAYRAARVNPVDSLKCE